MQALVSPPLAPIIAVAEDGEHLRLGSRGGADTFVISVLLQAAVNVSLVVEVTLGSRHTALPELYARGFWLSYSLFDVVVRTDVFHDLEVSEFPPIRDSFRVLSCVADLADFFAQQSLAVYLCTYGRVLAGVEIPLSALLAGELFTRRRQQQRPVVGSQASIEGSFVFPSAANSSFIDASVAVECVGTTAASTGGDVGAPAAVQAPPAPALHQEEEREEKREPEPISASQKIHDQPDTRKALTARISVDHIRISSTAVERWPSGEGISLELSAGASRATAAGVVRFRAFTKNHAIGDCDTLVVRLENSSLQDLQQARVSVCCISADSQRELGASQSAPLFNRDLEQDKIKDAPSWTLELPIYSATGDERIGACILRVDMCDSGDDDDAVENEPQPLAQLSPRSTGDRDVHVYRVFLQLKALREFEHAQELSILYQNPFTGKGKGEEDWSELLL